MLSNDACHRIVCGVYCYHCLLVEACVGCSEMLS